MIKQSILILSMGILVAPMCNVVGANPAVPLNDNGPGSTSDPVGKMVSYKEGGNDSQKMELFFPPNHDPKKEKVPGIILFHGGSWVGGTYRQFSYACNYFASRGLVCATVEYRKAADKHACITDAKTAIRWFKQHADELGIDPNRVITGGGSAGGHISALATLNPELNDPADSKDVDTKVVAYLWFNPAFALTDSKDAQIDILKHQKGELAPALVFFGDKDKWKEGWDIAYAKWKELGVKNIDLRIAEGQTHSFFNKEPWRAVTLIAADEFLVKQGLLKGEPTLKAPASGEKVVPKP